MLYIEHLTIGTRSCTNQQILFADITLHLPAGQFVAITGDSGVGKTTLVHAILGLLPPQFTIYSGKILYKDMDLTSLTPRELQILRSREIRFLPQQPSRFFNPLRTIGDHIFESLSFAQPPLHMSRTTRLETASQALLDVGLEPQILTLYPHQLSGGMLQRAAFAVASAVQPSLLIADEPTSALDSLSRIRWLDHMHYLQQKYGMSMLWITHQRDLARHFSDHVYHLPSARPNDREHAPYYSKC